MLYLPAGSSRLHRIHGPYVNEREVEAVCDFWRDQAQTIYNEEMLKPQDRKRHGRRRLGWSRRRGRRVDDELAGCRSRGVRHGSRVNFDLAAPSAHRLWPRGASDLMEKDGIVGPADESKARDGQ